MTAPASDVVVLGAGPYGLSIAAHLAATNLRTRVFGKPMQSWKDHMPRGMKLKSEGFASDLYDPQQAFPLRQYCREQNLPYADVGWPVPIETFLAYGLAFQQKFVPHLEPLDIVSVQRSATGFTLQTASGELVETRKLVVATGITNLSHLPEVLRGLPSEYVSHSFDHSDLCAFKGRTVAVLGAGSSAFDTAAILADIGASPHMVARTAGFAFHAPGPTQRTLLQRLRNPRSGLGAGWKSWLCTNLPLFFHAMPRQQRLRAVKRHLGPAPAWHVFEKVRDTVPMLLSTTLTQATIIDDRLHLKLRQRTSETTLIVDHLIAATGFRATLSRFPMLAEELRCAITTADEAPVLCRNFESSVPGLYFVGLASANSFGPLTRFAYGAGFTSKHITRHLVASASFPSHVSE